MRGPWAGARAVRARNNYVCGELCGAVGMLWGYLVLCGAAWCCGAILCYLVLCGAMDVLRC